MIVCSCNVFSDGEVRACVRPGPACPRTAADVYECLGCSPKCGRCARTIRAILTEAQMASEVAIFSQSSRHAHNGNPAHHGVPAHLTCASHCAPGCSHHVAQDAAAAARNASLADLEAAI